MEKKILSVLARKSVQTPPIWVMRQAGRYLPEYRKARERAGSFWAMMMDPKVAAEVTLHPIERFGFDAAIIFSDIFVITAGLGIEVTYEEGVGPRMRPVHSADEFSADRNLWRKTVEPVYEALGLVRAKLSAETALIGFAGGPWTLAAYLAQGQGSDDQRAAKLWAYRDPVGFRRLIDTLSNAVIEHLSGQIEAGAEVVQIFESWAQGVAEQPFADWVIAPTKKIVAALRTKHPKAKTIGFPRATSLEGYERYVRETGIDAVSIDTASPIGWAVRALSGTTAIQGNLDPIVLLAGGDAMKRGVEHILSATRGIPFIFNLGHGILPETPPSHVEELVALVRGR